MSYWLLTDRMFIELSQPNYELICVNLNQAIHIFRTCSEYQVSYYTPSSISQSMTENLFVDINITTRTRSCKSLLFFLLNNDVLYNYNT